MRRARAATYVLGGLLLVGCGTEEPRPPALDEAEGLDAREVLIRASLDVRGTRPTADELARLAEDEDALDAILNELSYHPGFGQRMGTIFAEAMEIRRDGSFVAELVQSDYGLGRESELNHAMVEEAVHVVELIAATDRPFTDVVTSDTSVVDPILFEVMPLEAVDVQPEGLPPGTTLVRYGAGFPAAGVISTSFTQRDASTFENAQRGRTNALTRAFLCVDFLDRPIDFPRGFQLADAGSIENAIREEAACQSCHATLDPLGSHLWGLWTFSLGDTTSYYNQYGTTDEGLWAQSSEVPPGYFGVPSAEGPAALGAAIAADSRFATCAVRRVYEDFLGREATLADEGQLALHRDTFVASGMKLRALVRSILDDPAYRGRAARSVNGGDPTPVAKKLLVPEQLDSALADMTGFRMMIDGRSAMRLESGLRGIAGGSEAGALRTPSPGHALSHRRLAEAAARALVDGHVTESRLGLLLAESDLSVEPKEDEVVAILSEALSLSEADRGEVASLVSLWRDVAATTADPREAWTTLLAAVLADPRFATY
jgi:hypothetical protein